MTSTSIWLEGAGGLRLRADEWPGDARRSVLFLHGAGQTRHAWGAAAGAVAGQGHRVLAIDHRGHGDSESPEASEFEVEDFAADVTAICAALPAPPVVVGASLGGVAALVAQLHADHQLFRAVVLVDTAAQMESEGVERVLGFMAANPGGFDSLDAAADAVAEYIPNRERNRNVSGMRKVLREGDNGRWYWHWDERMLESRVERLPDGTVRPKPGRLDRIEEVMTEGARRLEVPALIVRGAQSDVVSEDGAAKMLAQLGDGRVVDVSDAEHMVAGDRNDAFAAAVTEFIDGLPAALPVSSRQESSR